MIEDIFSVQVNFEDPSGHSSVKWYFEQSADNGIPTADAIKLAEAMDAEMTPLIVAALSDDFELSSFLVRKHYDNPQAQVTYTATTQQGTGSGPGLPSNNCALFGLQQGTFSVKSNGRFFLPGIPEVETTGGILNPAYQAGVLTAIAARLALPFNAPGDTGVYQPGIISQKALNAVPPVKDWPAAFAPLTSVSVSPVIAVQRRRTTNVIGGVS